MTQFAPIGPPALLKGLKEAGPNAFGTYHLVLAHEVLKHPAEYQELFQNKFYTTILDNGACELGQPLPPDRLLEAAEIVQATVICFPDVLHESMATRHAVRELLLKLSYIDVMGRSWMAIPQGHNLSEIITCAEEIVHLLGRPPAFWGVPRWITNDQHIGTRKSLVSTLSKSPFQRDPNHVHNIHLLGMSKNLQDDIECARREGVMGIDSANPLVLGQQGKDLIRDYGHPDRGKFWDETVLTKESAINVIKMRSLIQ